MDRQPKDTPREATPGSGLPRRPEDETGQGIVRDRPDLKDAIEPKLPRK